MKQIIFSIGIIFSFITVSAQTTNTFPLSGSAGIGTLSPSSYFHGGNNKVLEIYNPNTILNSQAHIILATGSTSNNSWAGTVSWVSKNSIGFQGMAYIAYTSGNRKAYQRERSLAGNSLCCGGGKERD